MGEGWMMVVGLVWDSGKINSIILKQINILTNFVIGLY
jgi:hypothetical protein